jgi:ADP-dependent NAD(P)H-hydrate dehydratase / NAD(P)H-hydrate epimerase
MHPNLNPDFATQLLADAKANDNKYSRGVVGFVTGSERYPGAALLGLEAAYELGIGMCEYSGPKEVSNLVLTKRPETVLGINKSKVLVIGSGIADDDTGQQVVNLLEASAMGIPLVIDAGALQVVDCASISSVAILTPHVGEAERLFARLGHIRHQKDIAANMAGSAQELSELTGQAVLLKGSLSVLAIAGFAPIESGPGSAHLATAGTGDVLAGMIGALAARFVAQGGDLGLSALRDCALLANQLHSEAAEVAAERGEFGASAVCGAISDVAA